MIRFCKKCQCETERSPQGACKKCAVISSMRWQKNNPEKVIGYANKSHIKNPNRRNEIASKYRKNNPDKVAISKSKYRKENIEKVSRDTLKWQKDNPDKTQIHSVNRRARKKAAGGKLSSGLKTKLFNLQRGHCAICKIKLSNAPRQQHMDHTIAISNGGANEDWNMQLLCQLCNLEKRAKDNLTFMQSKGYLI